MVYTLVPCAVTCYEPPSRERPETQSPMKVDRLLRGQHRKAAERGGALRALLCAVLLFAPSSARPGYRCGRYANSGASAVLDEQGRIHWWGRLVGPGQYYTEEVSPSGTGFTAIFTSKYAFAALDEEGRIHAWGDKRYGGSATSGSAGHPMACLLYTSPSPRD